MSEVKQVIVWRNDIKVRKGKFASQIAHASLGAVLKMMKKKMVLEQVQTECGQYVPVMKGKYLLEFEKNSFLDNWLNGRFTKICVSCDNEEQLLSLYNEAASKNIPTVLITDAGLTEFHGVATNTCIAIGPYWSEEIDKITRHLKLL